MGKETRSSNVSGANAKFFFPTIVFLFVAISLPLKCLLIPSDKSFISWGMKQGLFTKANQGKC